MPILGLARRDLLLVGAAAFALLCAGFVVTKVVITTEVDCICSLAEGEFPGDRLAALIAVAQSPHQSLARRNRAVWALGQLGDARAVEPLEGLLTGLPCDHDHFVCQREVRKALSVCRQPTWRARLENVLRGMIQGEKPAA